MAGTLTPALGTVRGARAAAEPTAALYGALHCDHPTPPPSPHCLARTHVLSLGRAPAPCAPACSPPLAGEVRRLAAIARSTAPVVPHGPTGSGKELAARALHQLSGRAGAFVAVNCGSIAKTLVETELFGYRKGAFSGAEEDRPGLMRTADKGTLFLDEIADLPASSQAALLRALQESEVMPVGATQPVKIDVRVLAATHFDLQKLVAEGGFRPALFERISGLTVRLAPLRDRRGDLGILIGDLLRRHAPGLEGRVSHTGGSSRALQAQLADERARAG